MPKFYFAYDENGIGIKSKMKIKGLTLRDKIEVDGEYKTLYEKKTVYVE
jgi:hypothetical protein